MVTVAGSIQTGCHNSDVVSVSEQGYQHVLAELKQTVLVEADIEANNVNGWAFDSIPLGRTLRRRQSSDRCRCSASSHRISPRHRLLSSSTKEETEGGGGFQTPKMIPLTRRRDLESRGEQRWMEVHRPSNKRWLSRAA